MENEQPLRERIAAAQQLRREFEGAQNIPPELLEAIGYKCVTGPDDAVSLQPIELVADKDTSSATQPEESTSRPFSVLSAEVAGNIPYVQSINEQIVAELKPLDEGDGWFKWLSKEHGAVQAFAASETTGVVDVGFVGGKRGRLEFPTMRWSLLRYVEHMLPGGRDASEVGYHELWLDNSLDVYTSAQIAQIMGGLESLKAKLTDVPQIEEFCNGQLMEMKWIDRPGMAEASGAADIEVAKPVDVDLASLSPAEKMAWQLGRFKKTLQVEGLAHVAGQLDGVTNLAEIRSVLAESPFADETLVRQMYDYFNLPSHFARATGEHIDRLLEMLSFTAGKNETISIDLVLDPGITKRYGDISVSSVEIESDAIIAESQEGRSMGQFLLVQTKTGDGQPVWHIQNIYTAAANDIDWDRFPRYLAGMLAPAAMKAGVHCITINATPEQISRQPHIATAFARYASEKMLKKPYDETRGFDESDFVDVRLDGDVFGGTGDGQVAIWRQTTQA